MAEHNNPSQGGRRQQGNQSEGNKGGQQSQQGGRQGQGNQNDVTARRITKGAVANRDSGVVNRATGKTKAADKTGSLHGVKGATRELVT